MVVMNTLLVDKMACQWNGIEDAMEFANNHPQFRPRIESVVDSYFDLIDEIAAELERGHMGWNDKIWTI
jgi:hypothetical protein